MGNSIYKSILDEASQAHVLRQPLLDKISQHFDRNVVCFYTSFSTNQGIINDYDLGMFRDILFDLNGEKTDKGLMILINSPGGDPLAAERIVKTCREFSQNDYWVLVPEQAKSAGTMIALGASKILMTPTSEIGPIDIQVPWNDELIPAHIIVSAYEEILKKGIELPQGQRIEPILQQLAVFNAPQIERLKLARELSKDIAKKILTSGMLQDIGKDEFECLLAQFINPEELKSHGRPIFYSDIKTCDHNNLLNVELIENESVLKIIHEYHMRLVFLMNSSRTAKIFETKKSAYTVPII